SDGLDFGCFNVRLLFQGISFSREIVSGHCFSLIQNKRCAFKQKTRQLQRWRKPALAKFITGALAARLCYSLKRLLSAMVRLINPPPGKSAMMIPTRFL